MTSDTQGIPKTRSIHGLRPDCLSFGEVLAQSFAVIAPTTIPASNLGLIVALSGNGTWLSFVIGLVGLVLVSLNINQFASRSGIARFSLFLHCQRVRPHGWRDLRLELGTGVFVYRHVGPLWVCEL